jgi:RHH-type proline utilization regulon transcriptional repressor/proline dehydrogenase/delta 1-pyrroline-5-carboxylate dehydrogenase
VGNAYVNRPITGAIVERQSFGGWKHSVVGPGAKAGGPNYVAQLTRPTTTKRPFKFRLPAMRVLCFEIKVEAYLGGADLGGAAIGGAALGGHRRTTYDAQAVAAAQLDLKAAASSDVYWLEECFGTPPASRVHDRAALFCEANELRYLALPALTVRVAAKADRLHVARVLLACAAVGLVPDLSAPVGTVLPDVYVAAGPLVVRRENTAEFIERLHLDHSSDPALTRIRLVGPETEVTRAAPASVYVDDRIPVLSGRVELLRYLREQAISTTQHRFGNLVLRRT